MTSTTPMTDQQFESLYRDAEQGACSCNRCAVEDGTAPRVHPDYPDYGHCENRVESLAILDNGIALEFYDDHSKWMQVRVNPPAGTFVAELVSVSAGTLDSTGVITLRWPDWTSPAPQHKPEDLAGWAWTGHHITRNISIDRLLAEADEAVQGVDYD